MLRRQVSWIASIARVLRAVTIGTPLLMEDAAAASVPSRSSLIRSADDEATVDIVRRQPPRPRLATPRLLAARLAVTARLNVPSGRVPFEGSHGGVRSRGNPRRVVKTEVKRAPVARSVYLPARHLAAKAKAQISHTNVVALPAPQKPTVHLSRRQPPHIRIAA